GETQIITLFAHILFNRRMVQQAVFMIDEPELSLHLAWQEMFVDSLKAANPELQVILATHSPAIIKGMDEQCVFVN
ncbi:ATP-binding protein, partial [Vibrio cholerae]|nr:ATP-binding protein [Vibrio cholerae]